MFSRSAGESAMTMLPIAVPFHALREPHTRSIWRRIGDAIERSQRRRAEREIAAQLRHHPDRDEFRVEFERRFMGQ
jgi:hypothetical protein